jgi:hypothetical protein
MELLDVLVSRAQVVILEDATGQIIKEVLVGFIDKTVSEHAVGLVHVQFNQVISILNAFVAAHCHALDDFAHVAQIESVVALSWRRQELLLSHTVDLNGVIYNLV